MILIFYFVLFFQIVFCINEDTKEVTALKKELKDSQKSIKRGIVATISLAGLTYPFFKLKKYSKIKKSMSLIPVAASSLSTLYCFLKYRNIQKQLKITDDEERIEKIINECKESWNNEPKKEIIDFNEEDKESAIAEELKTIIESDIESDQKGKLECSIVFLDKIEDQDTKKIKNIRELKKEETDDEERIEKIINECKESWNNEPKKEIIDFNEEDKESAISKELKTIIKKIEDNKKIEFYEYFSLSDYIDVLRQELKNEDRRQIAQKKIQNLKNILLNKSMLEFAFKIKNLSKEHIDFFNTFYNLFFGDMLTEEKAKELYNSIKKTLNENKSECWQQLFSSGTSDNYNHFLSNNAFTKTNGNLFYFDINTYELIFCLFYELFLEISQSYSTIVFDNFSGFYEELKNENIKRAPEEEKNIYFQLKNEKKEHFKNLLDTVTKNIIIFDENIILEQYKKEVGGIILIFSPEESYKKLLKIFNKYFNYRYFIDKSRVSNYLEILKNNVENIIKYYKEYSSIENKTLEFFCNFITINIYFNLYLVDKKASDLENLKLNFKNFFTFFKQKIISLEKIDTLIEYYNIINYLNMKDEKEEFQTIIKDYLKTEDEEDNDLFILCFNNFFKIVDFKDIDVVSIVNNFFDKKNYLEFGHIENQENNLFDLIKYYFSKEEDKVNMYSKFIERAINYIKKEVIVVKKGIVVEVIERYKILDEELGYLVEKNKDLKEKFIQYKSIVYENLNKQYELNEKNTYFNSLFILLDGLSYLKDEKVKDKIKEIFSNDFFLKANNEVDYIILNLDSIREKQNIKDLDEFAKKIEFYSLLEEDLAFSFFNLLKESDETIAKKYINLLRKNYCVLVQINKKIDQLNQYDSNKITKYKRLFQIVDDFKHNN